MNWFIDESLGRSRRIRQGAKNIQNVPQLGKSHPISIEEFAEREFVVNAIGVLVGQMLRDVIQKAKERPLDQRKCAYASFADARKFLRPSGQEVLPFSGRILHVVRGSEISELLALDIN